MRLAQHLFYAVAALIGVSLVALKDPALPMAMEMAGGPAATCRGDHLERPCDPGGTVAGIMQAGHVMAR